MKRFLISVFVGGAVGVLVALGFLYIAPQLPYIFAKAFFYPQTHNPVTVIQDVVEKFKPNPNQYIISSVDQSISTTTKVIYADLGSMNISLYENGELKEQYPIKSIGREGTAWQTPLGMFKMNYKKENHFSSIGHVWMPYSMHFFGNYFIHGWPYYEGGMPVAEGYSGGCIRLNTPDAEKIFAFSDKSTQLIVTTSNKKEPLAQGDFKYKVEKDVPEIQSKFAVVDVETGEVVGSSRSQEQVPIGSFAKLMTGLISLETLNQYQDAILNQDIVKVADVLYALLLGDSNDAGTVLSEQKNKAQYLIDMNTRAQSLGMSATLYKDTNGDATSTVSSLEDTFKLLQYVYTYKPYLIKLLSLEGYTKDTFTISAIHPLKKISGYKGGFVSGDQKEMITFIEVQDGALKGKTFVVIVHDSFSSTEDTQKLIEWLGSGVSVRRDV